MPKYLVEASYTTEGAKGLLKDGGTKRRAAVEALMKELGGKVEAFYFAFGDTDAFIIIDGPDNITAAAVAIRVNSSGAVNTRTTPLLTPEDIDEATKKTIAYQAPGR